MSQFALWLNSFFAGFDNAVSSLFHSLAELAPEFFNPLFYIITLIGEKGILLIAFGIALLFSKKTRKAGVAVLVSIVLGYLLVNLTLKPIIGRPRPFLASSQRYEWWQFAGAVEAGGKSFPSGHTNVVACASFAFAFAMGKKWLIPSALLTLLVGASRIYLQVHYPSDILGGIVTGIFCAVLANLLVSWAQKIIARKKAVRS